MDKELEAANKRIADLEKFNHTFRNCNAYFAERIVELETSKSVLLAEIARKNEAIAELEAQPAKGGEPVGKVVAMPGTGGDFTMATFNGADVPPGINLYTHPAPDAEVMRLAQEINRYFTSGDSVQVEHARIPKIEWDQLFATIAKGGVMNTKDREEFYAWWMNHKLGDSIDAGDVEAAFFAGRASQPAPIAHEWQPIETAPKGQEMFVVKAFNADIGKSWPYVSDAYCVWSDNFGFARWPHPFPPTHWAPLPQPPEPTK